MRVRTTAAISLIVLAAGLAMRDQVTVQTGKAAAPPAQRAGCGPALDFGIELKDPAGRTVKLADYRGKVVLLNVWATWCDFCKAEKPVLAALHSSNRDNGFAVLGVATYDTAEAVRAFLSESPTVNYQTVMVQPDLEEALGPIRGLPTSFFISRDGAICKTQIGPVKPESAQREIAALM